MTACLPSVTPLGNDINVPLYNVDAGVVGVVTRNLTLRVAATIVPDGTEPLMVNLPTFVPAVVNTD